MARIPFDECKKRAMKAIKNAKIKENDFLLLIKHMHEGEWGLRIISTSDKLEKIIDIRRKMGFEKLRGWKGE